MEPEDTDRGYPVSRRRYVSAMAGLMGIGIGSTGDGTIGSIAEGGDTGDYDAVAAADEEGMVTVNLYQTRSQTAAAEEARVEPFRALNVIKAYAEPAFNDLYDRAGFDSEFVVNVVGEPGRPLNDEDVMALQDDFGKYCSNNPGEVSSYSNLVVDSTPELDSLWVIGAADAVDGYPSHESCHGSYSDVGALAHGEGLLELSPDEQVDEFKTQEYHPETDTYELVQSNKPLLFLTGAVHELGHMECLRHWHGDTIYEPEDEPERAVRTLMTPRKKPLKDADVFRRFTFSEDAEKYVNGEKPL